MTTQLRSLSEEMCRTTILDCVNPVTRMGAAMILTFPLFITLDWVSALTVVALEIVIWLALCPRHMGSRLRTLGLRAIPFVVAAPLAGLSMALYGNPDGQIFFTWGLIVVSEQSLSYAAAVAARVIALGMACLVTLIGVDPTDMADGLAQVWHLPSHFVLGTLAAVRLVARLGDDWRTMQLARKARGLGDHGVLHRYATLAFALLVSAIRRGSTLATAMETRGFGRGRRTWARPSKVGVPDIICLGIAAGIVGFGLALALVTGHFRWIGDVL
ncbi:MAG: energy-coupling factor transporter transmembrane protein EcfT [Propionibacteriaceae bacterium]|jgi:energy-coupling factor transport system permease protein|nr:energy-coupling factor transporter transmembrane protein EcfT [Propionibacteriaceae bacterium]